jgi:hypothetical protein
MIGGFLFGGIYGRVFDVLCPEGQWSIALKSSIEGRLFWIINESLFFPIRTAARRETFSMD